MPESTNLREKRSEQMSLANLPVAPIPTTPEMRISINCTQVNPHFVGGVTTYTLGLLEGLAKVGQSCQFRVFVSTANQHLFESFGQFLNFEIVKVGQTGLALRSNLCRAALLTHSSRIYESAGNVTFRKIRKMVDEGADVTYTPTTLLPYFDGVKPCVLTMHDIQHVHHPEFFNWARRLSRRITYDLSARRATHFQVSSRYIGNDLLEHFPWLQSDQIEVIHHGVHIDKFATRISDGTVRLRHRLPERFLFYPAQLWPHKNHLTLLKALKRIEDERKLKIPLVLTGDKYAAAPRIFGYIKDQAMDYVHYLGKVSFREVVELHQQAAFTVSASLHEASSFPILEAAAAGTPVIASKIPAFEELGETLRLNLFESLNSENLAELVHRLWNDRNMAASQSAYNRNQVAEFSWENAANGYLRFFRRILGR